MNIAHILPRSVYFPMQAHNGRYSWVENLAKIQTANGHNVTIYCNPSSRLDGVSIQGVKAESSDRLANNISTFQLAMSNNHDILHSHFDNLHYRLADQTKKNIVFTQHWWPSDETIRLSNEYNPMNVWGVPPTKYMFEFDIANNIKTKGHIYHGIDLSSLDLTRRVRGERLLIVGRISPDKNIDLAISIAEHAKIGLDIVGRIPPKHQSYWESIKHRVDGDNIKYHGPKNQQELAKMYKESKALLFPSSTNEAFGLVAIEAQAYGTPVLMQRGGSRGELIQEGLTGFLCNSLEEFKKSINKLDELKESDCVEFSKGFVIQKMAKAYDELYNDLLSEG